MHGSEWHRARLAPIDVVLVASLLMAVGLAGCGSPAPAGPPSASSVSPAVATRKAGPSLASSASGSSGSSSLLPTASPGLPSTAVTAFYYAWYGTLANDGAWRHWNQNGHQPPGDIASQYYPQSGPYSSRDPAILATQMADLRAARIGVIAVSWWGRGGWDDQTLPALFTAAAAAGVQISFHLEPYTGQSAASIVADIRYLLGRFGTSPALYRVARPTSADASTAPRPVFYVFAPSRLAATDLKTAFGSLRGTADDSIIMIHSPKAISAVHDGGDGVYTYDPVGSPDAFAALVADCRTADIICSPSVSPGFDNRQAVSTGQQVVDRQNGTRYDATWQAAVAARPEWISVVSFNEWHEGTEIEPAVDYSSGSRTYQGFEGAYGTTGSDAPGAYLRRTAYWVGLFTPAS